MEGVFPIKPITGLTNIDILAVFVVAYLSVIILRYKGLDVPRFFRLPFIPILPVFGVMTSGFLLQPHRET